MPHQALYIYNDDGQAEAIRMTAHYLGYSPTRIGSAVLMEPEAYHTMIDKTLAPPATLICSRWEGAEE